MCWPHDGKSYYSFSNVFDERASIDAPPEKLSGEVLLLLDRLVKLTGIDFSDSESTKFDWYSGEDFENIESISIVGKKIEVKKISWDDQSSIVDFFDSEGFVLDQNNVADGSVAGLEGYKKENLVCHIYGEMTGGEEALDSGLEIDTVDVEIKCGLIIK